MIRDDVTIATMGKCDQWRDVFGLDDAGLAAQIAQDQIDILVDLSGHTAAIGSASSPAGLRQFNSAGWVILRPPACRRSTRCCWMTDILRPAARCCFPSGSFDFPGGRFCYRPPDYAGPRIDEHAGIMFGSFNNAAKLNGPVIAPWSRILAATPNSRLTLKWRAFTESDPAANSQTFAAHGVTRDQLVFAGASEHPAMLEAYNAMMSRSIPSPSMAG